MIEEFSQKSEKHTDTFCLEYLQIAKLPVKMNGNLKNALYIKLCVNPIAFKWGESLSLNSSFHKANEINAHFIFI